MRGWEHIVLNVDFFHSVLASSMKCFIRHVQFGGPHFCNFLK